MSISDLCEQFSNETLDADEASADELEYGNGDDDNGDDEEE